MVVAAMLSVPQTQWLPVHEQVDAWSSVHYYGYPAAVPWNYGVCANGEVLLYYCRPVSSFK
jgi:hypothetical protein